jgi:hypothetical protein
LFAAPGSNQPESALRQWTEVGGYPQVIWFNTGDRAGSVIPVVAHFTNVPPDAPVATVQMRVWDNRTSVFSWDQVLADPTLARGVSPTFNVYNIGGGVNVPPYLFPGLVSFNMFTPAATNPIMLLNPRRDANSIAFDFLVKLGKTYHVEYKSNLSDTLWNELTSVVGTGFTNFTDTTPTNDARFYRVRVQ